MRLMKLEWIKRELKWISYGVYKYLDILLLILYLKISPRDEYANIQLNSIYFNCNKDGGLFINSCRGSLAK
jgi:hypothetical protein